jgi:WW domain-containing oxidoreductase
MTSKQFDARSTADDVLSGIELTGKTILITGCSSGLGVETMRSLAQRGARIIALARTADAARQACSAIGHRHVPIGCDLADLHSVASAIDAVRKVGTPLDTIITNAGIAAPSLLQVRYGVELQFLVNHLAHFLLVTRLSDLVPDSTGRIVIGSSSSSVQQAPKEGIMFDNLDGRRFYKPFMFYGQSKFATALFAKELSRRISRRDIRVNAVHPGATRGTHLNRDLPLALKAVLKVAQPFMKTPAQGAATQCLLAANPSVAGISGEYWADCRIAKGNPLLDDEDLANRLWEASESIIIDAIGCERA